jgi:O-methyltransferase
MYKLKNKIKEKYKQLKLRPFRFRPIFLNLSEFLRYSEREIFLLKSFDFIRSNKIKGDYLEFGVSEGNTFIAAYHIAQNMGKNLKNMNFLGFDSFEGIPPLKNKLDKEGFVHFKEGDYSYSYKKIINKLTKCKVDLKKVKLIRGWYNQTLNKKTKREIKTTKAAIIYIDSDLYESAVYVLEFIKDYLQNGTILVFDDWFCFRGDPGRGEQKAFKEWLQKNKKIECIEFQKFGWYGNSFIVRMKE